MSTQDVPVVSVHDFTSFVNALVDATRRLGCSPWWRGHADASWKLHPSLYHKRLSANEANMLVRFKQLAPARHRLVPPSYDMPGWTFLMQHYGLPTRLMDWSESPLVALHFAVESESFDDEDAIVWGLSPTKLNQAQIGTCATLGTGNAEVQTLFQQAWDLPNSGPLCSQCLAICADQADIRQMVQAAACTIHGGDTPLQDAAFAKPCLYGVRISANTKQSMRQLLNVLHVQESYLFPDLEHLANAVQHTKFRT